MVVASTPASLPTLEAIGAEIFESLWGPMRDPIPTVVDHAFQRIWAQLITGERKPGERLSDTDLAAQLGISRTPVRQALHRLTQDELVRFDPRRGFRVKAFSAEDVQEMYSVRCALEVLAVRLAASHLHAEELRAQLDHVSLVRASSAKPPITLFLQHDFRLHNFLIQASRNGRLIRMLAMLRGQVSLFQIRNTADFPGRMETALDGHERILLALLEGNTEQAAASMAEHMRHSLGGILADIFDVEPEKEVLPYP